MAFQIKETTHFFVFVHYQTIRGKISLAALLSHNVQHIMKNHEPRHSEMYLVIKREIVNKTNSTDDTNVGQKR